MDTIQAPLMPRVRPRHTLMRSHLLAGTRLLVATCFLPGLAAAQFATALAGSNTPMNMMQPALALRPVLVLLDAQYPTRPDGAGSPTQTSGVSYHAELRWMAVNFPDFSVECDEAQGQTLSISSNSLVYSLLGTSFGGNGTTNFQLPDLRGRFAVGAGTGSPPGSYAIGSRWGFETTTLISSNLPAHSHAIGVLATGAQGSGIAIDNSQPSLAMHYIINAAGELRLFAGTFAPDGWALAHGQILQISQHPALHDLIGTAYGGDGATTFALPDLRGRVPVGSGQGPGLPLRTRGQVLGSASQVLTAAQVREHAHGLSGSGTTGTSGENAAIDTHQPSLVINYAISTGGTFPTSEQNPWTTGTPAYGEVRAFAGTIPAGFLPADGRLLPIIGYEAMYAVIGTTYGGDGLNNFALPDLRGRAILGIGQGPLLSQRPIGQISGAPTHVMSLAELPAHLHTVAHGPGELPNPGFEADTFTVYPGYIPANGGKITGWVHDNAARTGLNPAAGNPFANNGSIPQGNNVAFLQSDAGGASTLSTSIYGLTPGLAYTITFRANARDYLGGQPAPTWSYDGGPFVPLAVTAPVGGTTPYHTVTGTFTATGPIVSLAVRNQTPTDTTLLIDAFTIAPATNPPWVATEWTDDSSSGLDPYETEWACSFGSAASPVINGVALTGIGGANPALSGAFTTSGLPNVFLNDSNNLTTAGGTGSALLARDFVFGANPGQISLEGLMAGRRYTLAVFGVGYDTGVSRTSVFAGPFDSISANENSFGNNTGVRLAYSFRATGPTHAIAIHPQAAATYHLYGIALAYHPPVDYAEWKLEQFAAQAGNPAATDRAVDHDGDGQANLLEYGIRTSPVAANPGAFLLPEPVTLPGNVLARRFSIPFQPQATDLAYVLQRSGDLHGWNEVYRRNHDTEESVHIPGVSATPDAAARVLYIDITDPALFTAPVFWRLAVEPR